MGADGPAGHFGPYPPGSLALPPAGIVVDLDADGEEVYSDRKVQALKRNGLVVYVRRPVAYLEERIRRKEKKLGGNSQRPQLSASKSFQAIMERRDPWYAEAADLVLDGCTSSGAPVPKEELVARMLEFYYAESGNKPDLRKGCKMARSYYGVLGHLGASIPMPL